MQHTACQIIEEISSQINDQNQDLKLLPLYNKVLYCKEDIADANEIPMADFP